MFASGMPYCPMEVRLSEPATCPTVPYENHNPARGNQDSAFVDTALGMSVCLPAMSLCQRCGADFFVLPNFALFENRVFL